MISVPKVTVLMSVLNGDRYLSQSIDSILNQTFTDFEFLIVDDGSTDGTWRTLVDYSSRDTRLALIRNEKNVGLTKSLNKGLKMARGKYIARQDADDVSLPERLETQVRFLEDHQRVGLMGSLSYVLDENDRVFDMYWVPSNDDHIRWALLFSNPFVHGTVMFRRSLIQNVGFYNDEVSFAQDYDYWARISDVAPVANIAKPLASWRLNMSGISQMSGHRQQASALRTSVDQVSKWIGRHHFDDMESWAFERIQDLCKFGRLELDALAPETALSTAEDYLGFADEYLENSIRQRPSARKSRRSISRSCESVALGAVGHYYLRGSREVGIRILVLLLRRNMGLLFSPLAWRTISKLVAKRGWPRWLLQIVRGCRGVILNARYRISVD